VNLLDPDVVVVGGGLGSAPGPFWRLGVAAARDHVWCDAARGLPILQAELGPRSGAVGAAIVGFEASRPLGTSTGSKAITRSRELGLLEG
jgi:glucokinase